MSFTEHYINTYMHVLIMVVFSKEVLFRYDAIVRRANSYACHLLLASIPIQAYDMIDFCFDVCV
jgi:hypothetical protein